MESSESVIPITEAQYKEHLNLVYSVYEVFKEFYGEEYIDLQGILPFENIQNLEYPSNEDLSNKWHDDIWKWLYEQLPINILVWFPKVRVENEIGEHIDITNLYAKIPVSYEGTFASTLTFNRSEYTIDQYENHYIHSHVMHLQKDCPEKFQSCCLGTGPLRDTISTLTGECDFDIWKLFCLELSKYVQVESVKGVPYTYLKNVFISYSTLKTENFYRDIVNLYGELILDSLNCFTKQTMSSFIDYLIRNVDFNIRWLSFTYEIGLSPIEYYVKVSNAFISWYNRGLQRGEFTHDFVEKIRNCINDDNNILIKVAIKNENIHILNTYAVQAMNGNTYLFTFKGEKIYLKITNHINSNENFIYLLNPIILNYIYYCILEVINYRNGNFNREESRVKFL